MTPNEIVDSALDLMQKDEATTAYVRLSRGKCQITDAEGFPYGDAGSGYDPQMAEIVASTLRERGFTVEVACESVSFRGNPLLEDFRRLSGVAPSQVDRAVTSIQTRFTKNGAKRLHEREFKSSRYWNDLTDQIKKLERALKAGDTNEAILALMEAIGSWTYLHGDDSSSRATYTVRDRLDGPGYHGYQEIDADVLKRAARHLRGLRPSLVSKAHGSGFGGNPKVVQAENAMLRALEKVLRELAKSHDKLDQFVKQHGDLFDWHYKRNTPEKAAKKAPGAADVSEYEIEKWASGEWSPSGYFDDKMKELKRNLGKAGVRDPKLYGKVDDVRKSMGRLRYALKKHFAK